MKSKSKSQEIKVTNVKKVNTPTLDEIEAEKIKIQPVGYPFNFNLLDATPLEISDEKLFEEYAKEQWLGLEVKKNSYLFDQKIIPDYGFKIIEAQPDNSIITEKTHIKVIDEIKTSQEIKPQKYHINFDDIIGQENAKNKVKIIKK